MELDLILKRVYFVIRRRLSGHRVLHMRLTGLDDLPEIEIPPGYQIRGYQEGDDRGWVDVINRAMNPVWSEKRFKDQVLSAESFQPENLIIVTREGSIVGTACALPEGVVHLVAVLPGHRGKRLGWLASLGALHRLHKMGHTAVTLVTDTSRIPAIRLYESLGFEKMERPPR